MRQPRNPVFQGIFEGLRRRPKRKVAQWAHDSIILPREVSSIPGKLRVLRYQAGIMAAIDDPAIETIVLMTSSQVGKSELLTAVALYFTVEDPSKILFIQPKDDAANEFKSERFDTIIRASPEIREPLRGYVGMRGHDMEGYLAFPGGFIDFKGSGSPTNLAGKPIRVLLMDEIDRYEGSIGGEGDAVTLASKRTTTEHSRKILLASTPKAKDRSRIERLFQQTDQRFFYIECPNCKHWQTLEFELAARETIVRHPKLGTCYVCSECAEFIDQSDLREAVAKGEWRQTSVGRPGWAGFHIWEAYSPFSSLEKVLEQWESAEGDPLDEQGFVNTVLGKPFEGTLLTRKDPEVLAARRERIDPKKLPFGLGCITASVDVQGDRVEVMHVGWGVDEERWILGIERLYGNVNGFNLWQRVTEQLRREFIHATGLSMFAEAVCIDAGFATNTVVDYVGVARQNQLNYYAIIGRSGEGKPLWAPAKNKLPGKTYLVGVDEGKTDLYLALTKTQEGPGYVHLSDTLAEDMIEQLVAEVCKVETNSHGMSKRTWELPVRRRNEALDLAVYAHAAYKSLGMDISQRLEAMYGPPVKQADIGAIARSFRD